MSESMTSPEIKKSASVSRSRAQPVILIVEDEAALVALLRYNLERDGFRVIEAANGEEGMLLMREERPDLVILDWMLPVLSGIEFCRQARRSPEVRARDREITISWSNSAVAAASSFESNPAT